MSAPALLRFENAVLAVALPGLPRLEVDAVIAAGELVLVDTEAHEQERALVDAALGLAPPLAGEVRFRDHDWQRLPAHFRDALRGRCGLVPREGGLVPYAGLAENVLLARRFHARTPDAALLAEAATLARRFGLPGLPVHGGESDNVFDRLRLLCLRAFLGEPWLVMIESRAEPWRRELVGPVVDALQAVRERGGAGVWFVADDPIFDDRAIPATRRLRPRGRHLEAPAP